MKNKLAGIGLILVLAIFSLMACVEEPSKVDTSKQVVEQETEPVKEVKQELSNETLNQKNARERAESNLDLYLSKQGFVEYLVYVGFSQEDSEYAVGTLKDIDWNEVCYSAGKSYLDEGYGFSQKEIREQLLFQKFTEQEVEYAVNKLGY